jgi:hypothetical protein
MPGITPWCASSRRQIRQRPNFRNTARGRPHRLQRVYARVRYFWGRRCLTTSDVFATVCYSLLAPSPPNGRPKACSSARAWSSVSALVVIVTSRPRTCWMSS